MRIIPLRNSCQLSAISSQFSVRRQFLCGLVWTDTKMGGTNNVRIWWPSEAEISSQPVPLPALRKSWF